jgi:hypothetical protein
VTLDEYLRQNPPSVGKNHYKGEDVYANFGYFKVDDDWVDPESEYALHEAYMSASQHSEEHPDLPNLYGSHSSGPRIMTAEEQDEFYWEYVKGVTDEKDGEGDPRRFRISAKTFAAWAAGAAAGDCYEESSFEPTVNIFQIHAASLPCSFRLTPFSPNFQLRIRNSTSYPLRSRSKCNLIWRRAVSFLAYTIQMRALACYQKL